jgi:CheY-like chemotaxis protein
LWPIDKVDAVAKLTALIPQESHGKQEMKSVLLVEDNRILQLASQRVLTRAGYRVLTAEDGEKALAIAHSDNPDIVLLDMMLPKLSGPEVLSRLKHDPSTAHIPVIVLTGLSKKNEDKLRKEGAVAFMEKSQWAEAPNLLLLTIEKVLNEDTAGKDNFDRIPLEGNKSGLAVHR